MKLSLVLSVLFFFGAVQCSFGSKVKKNETAVERPSRESRKYLHFDGYGNRHEEYDSHKQRPNRFKGRRRSKPSTTTPAYDYGDYDDNSSKETKTVYESYFKHPSIGNVGKIFNQKDINDYFLKGNGDYSKLVKDVVSKTQSSPHFENNSTPKLREESNYKTIVSYDKNDPPSPSYNFASKETPVSSYSYGIKDSSVSSFSSKNKDTPVSSFKYDDKNTPVTSYSYGNKDISSSFSSDTKGLSDNYGNKDTSFPKFNYDSKDTPSSYSYGNKDASNYNYYFDIKDTPISSNKYKESQSPSLNYGKDATISSYSYGNKDNYASFTSGTSDTMTSNGWSAMIPKYTTTTISPFDYNQLYGKRPSLQKEVDPNPPKNYASDFNFDTKPLADIQPTKYTVPYGKFTLKNTDFVSEFDAKGNPIPSSSETMNDYSPEKDYSYDFAKSFYDYNSNNKPLKIENFFNQNPKNPSDSSFGWDWDNKGYASNYDYFGKAYQAAFLQRNPDYSKYELPSAYKGFKYSGSVRISFKNINVYHGFNMNSFQFSKRNFSSINIVHAFNEANQFDIAFRFIYKDSNLNFPDALG